MCSINVKQCILHGKYNNSLTFIAQKTADETPLSSPERLRTHLESTVFVLTTIFRAESGSVIDNKFTIRFKMLIMKIWVQPLLWPVGRGRCGHSLFFVLEGKETNKSFKDTMSLNGIDHKISRYEYLNPVIRPTFRHFRLARWFGPI
jgi:hypothetical protein